MSVYKNIFVSDEFEGLEAGTQVQGIDGSVRVFGESAFSSLEQAVSSVSGKAVIARVASGKYDYFVADGNGSVSPASQVVFVDFNGGSDLSYDNGEFSRPVEMAPAAYSAAQQADVVAALNDLNAGSGVVFTSVAPQDTEFSTVYVGSTSSFDDLGSFKGLSETVDAGNAIPNDEAFVNTNHISSIDELIEVIDHEAGHLVGEEHEVQTGTIGDYALNVGPLYVNASWTQDTELAPGLTWGVNAFNKIETAVANADTSTGVVDIYVQAGTYNEIVRFGQGQTFTVDDQDFKGRVNLQADTTDGEVVLNGGFYSAWNITLRDVTVNGFTLNNTTRNNGWFSPFFLESYGEENHSNITITNNIINAPTDDKGGESGLGIALSSQNLSNITISGNTITASTGLYIGANGSDEVTGSGIVLSGNTITCGPTWGNQGTGIEIYGLYDDTEITNNVVTTVGDGETIWIRTKDDYVISGNTFNDISDDIMDVVYSQSGNYETLKFFPVEYNGNKYDTINEAVAAAQGDDEAVITLTGPVAGNAVVTGGQQVTFTGEATLKWKSGWFFVGRGGEQADRDAVTYVTFKDAAIGNTEPGTYALGFNVSKYDSRAGKEQTNTGVLTFEDSVIATDYIYNANVVNVINTTLTAGNMSISGKEAAESRSGEDEAAYLNLSQGSHVTVLIENGHNVGDEGGGVLNITGGSTFLMADANNNYVNRTWSITDKGQVNLSDSSALIVADKLGGGLVNNGTITIDGTSTVTAEKLTNNGVISIDVTDIGSTETKLIDTNNAFLGEGTIQFVKDGEVVTSSDYTYTITDGDLYAKAKLYVAEVNGTKYETLSAAYTAAAAGTTEIEKTVKLLVNSIDSITGIPTGVTVEGVEGRTTVTSTLSSTLNDVTLKNIKFAASGNALRWCYLDADRTFVIDNCEFAQGGSYGLHFDGNDKGDVIVRNSILKGWNSFADSLKSVTIEDSVITPGSYAMIRSYVNTTFTNCRFTEAFAGFVDLSEGSGVELFGENTVMELSGCSIIKSKDDPTVSTEYTVKDLIVREPYGDIGSTNKVGVKSDTSMIVIDPVKDGEGKYTAGSFFANTAAAIDGNLATASLADIVDASRGLVYELGETAAIEIRESIAGTVNVPDGVEFTVADGITYGADAKLTGNVAFDVTNAEGSVTFEDATVSSKIGNVTADGTTAFVNTNIVSGATIAVAGNVTNTGTLVIDPTTKFTAGTFSGENGSITVDLSNFEGSLDLYRLIDTADDAGTFGSVTIQGSEMYKTATLDGDLYLQLAAAPDVTAAQKEHTGAGGDDIYVAPSSTAEPTTSVAGNVEAATGAVTIANTDGSSLMVGDVAAAKDVTIEAAAGAKDTQIGDVASAQDVAVTNTGDGTMQVGAVAAQNVSITNDGTGSLSVTGDTEVAELLEIRNETDSDLSHSGKLAAKDINIYNNEQDATKVGEIKITQQIEALGDISINNDSTKEVETNEGGQINLGTQEHTAQGGLNIVNKENNVINGGGSAATEDEQAANITVKEDVVIANDGHMNANIKTDKAIEITNTSVNTLIGSYEGAELNLDNTGGAAHDVTLTATAGDIKVINAKNGDVGGTIDTVTMTAAGSIAISGDGTTTNATINTDTLFMGGTSVEITDGTILNADSTIYLAENETGEEVPGAALTITGDHTVGAAINADSGNFDPVTEDPVFYGTVTMNGTQVYTGDISADAIVVADNADVTIDNATFGSTHFDFNSLAINGTLTTDFDAQNSFTGAGTVTGAGNLQISTDGEWIINDSVYRDFSGFTGKVSMTENNAKITMGLGDAPTATPLEATDSYFADGVEMTAAAGQAINLKGADVTTGIVFKGDGTLNVFENQTLTADSEIALTQVAEGKTLTLAADNYTSNITLDKDADTAATTLKLNKDGLTVTGTITGDSNDIIDADASATLASDAALDNFSGTVDIEAAATTVTLTGANTTAANFTGAGTIDADADQTLTATNALNNFTGTVDVAAAATVELDAVNTTAATITGAGTIDADAKLTLTADAALDTFTGTVALEGNELVLSGANSTAATFTGTAAGKITAAADQTLSGDISGFSGVIDADGSEVTISGTVADVLNVAGDTIVLDDAVAHTTPITVNAVDALDVLDANDNDIVAASGAFDTITADEGNVKLTGATVTNVATDEGSIDLTEYAAGTLDTVVSLAGEILITSAQNITVTTALDGDLAYTVTALQTDDTADLTFTNGTLSYTDDITVTAAVSSYFESPYKLLGAQTLDLAADFSVNLTVGTDSGDIVIGNAAKIGDKFYQLSLTGDAGSMQYLELTVFSGTSNIAYVNNTDPTWTAATPYAEVFDTFYADTTISVKRNIGYDAAASIDNAIGYIVADTTGDDAGKGWIELTENVTYSIGTALGTASKGVTNMTLRSRSDWGNAKVTGDINAGAATTLNLENLTATGSVYGAGTVNITGAKANRFSGTNIAAGGALNITGGTYTTRYIAGGAYNADSTADTSVTINGAADRTSISGTIYGGSIATGSGNNVTQSGKATVTINANDKVYLAGNIYAAGLARAGATLSVTGDREVTFTGVGSNLNFTGRVSGAAQGATPTGGTANLNFADFVGKFNGSISDFNTITISGGSALQLGRRQTLTGSTAVNFELTDASVAGTSMYTVRDKNAWEFAKSITITADPSTASGTYVLADNYAAGFDGFTFTVAGQNYTLGSTTTDNNGNTYSVGYAGEKLSLTFGNAADTQVIDNAASQDADSKEFIIYATDVNGAELTGDTSKVDKISATADTTVVFNDDTQAALLDQNAAGALLYKATDTSTSTTSIEWVGNSDTANVTGGLTADSMDISGKTLSVDTANINELTVDEDATLNLTGNGSTIGTVTIDEGKSLTLSVAEGQSATVNGITVTNNSGTVTINNEGTLTAQVTDAGTVVISNTSFNSLYGAFGGANTESIALANTGKVQDASFTATQVTLNDAVNVSDGALGYYKNISVDATKLTLNADLAGWTGSLAGDAIYSFANGAAVTALNITIDGDTSFGTAETLAVVTGADLSETVYKFNGSVLALGDTVTVGTDEYVFNLFEGDAYFFKGEMPVADMTTLVIDSALADDPAFTVVTYEGNDYIVGLNAFSTTAQMRAAITEDTENLLFKAGNAESYGDLDVDQNVTISTTGEGEALLSRYQTDDNDAPANTVTVAEGSTFRFTSAGALTPQDTIILNGTLIFNTSSFAGDKNMYSKSNITVNETGSLVYESYAMQNTREPLTVYGTMVIGDPDEDTTGWNGYAIGGYPKIAGNETQKPTSAGTLIIDGENGTGYGVLNVYAPAFSVAGGYASTWKSSAAASTMTVQNGGSVTSNAYMFRNGTLGVITVKDGSSFTITPDDKYSGIIKLTDYATGNDGVINVQSGSTVDFGTLADFNNAGTINVSESTFAINALTNSGTIEIADSTLTAGGTLTNGGVVNVSGQSSVSVQSVSGNDVNLLDGATLTDSALTGYLYVHGNAVIEDSSVGTVKIGRDTADESGTLTIGENVTMTGMQIGYGASLPSPEGITQKVNFNYDTAVNGTIYAFRNSDVTVANGATLAISNELYVYNKFTITDASTVTAGANYLILAYGDNIDFTVDAHSTLTVNTGWIQFGETLFGDESGAGTFTVKNGSVAALNGSSMSIKAAMSVVVDDAAFTSTANITNNGLITLTDGTFTTTKNLTNSGSVTIDTASLLTAASLTNSGTITIDAANFAGGYKKVIDLSQGTALSDINLINAADDVSLSYGTDGDVYVVDSSSLTGTLYVNTAWSELEPGTEITIIPGVTAIYGTDAFSTVSETAAAATADTERVIFVGGGEYASGAVKFTGSLDFSSDELVTFQAGEFDLGTKHSEWGEYDKETYTLSGDYNFFQFATSKYANVDLTIDGNVYLQQSAWIKAGTHAVLTEGSTIQRVNSGNNGQLCVYGTLDVAGTVDYYTQVAMNHAFRVGNTEYTVPGELNVTGSVSIRNPYPNNNNIYAGGIVGVAANGTINIADGGSFSAEGTITNDGAINIADGELTAETLVNNGTVTASGTVTMTAASYSGNEILVADGTTVKDSSISGAELSTGENPTVLTFEGANTIGRFSMYANDKVVIGEGASVYWSGSRGGLGYGNAIDIDGTISAGTARDMSAEDKAALTASLSTTGLSLATSSSYGASTLSVDNAYVVFGNESGQSHFTSKASYNYGGSYDIDFTNSVVDINGNLSIQHNVRTNNPTYEFTFTGSQLNITGRIVNDVDNSTMTFDNTVVATANAFRNSGTFQILNGSDVSAGAVNAWTDTEKGELNAGSIVVDKSTFTVTTGQQASHLHNIGGITLSNDATMTIDYLVNTNGSNLTTGEAMSGSVGIDASSKLTVSQTLTNDSVINGNVSMTDADNTLTMDVDSILNGAVDMGAGTDTVAVTGVKALGEDVAGAKVLAAGGVANAEAYKIDNVAVTLGEATQISEDVWAKLTNDDSLIVSWGRTAEEVTAASDALDAQKNEMTIGQAVVADATALSDGAQAEDFTKKNNGTLA